MTLHLLKLVWHRKRANSLVMAEIFFSFLVLFTVLTAGATVVSRWNDPLGFEWQNVWVIRFDTNGHDPDPNEDDGEFRFTMQKLLNEVKSFPQVVDAAAGMTPPYGNSTSSGSWKIDGKKIDLTRDEVTDSYANTMRMKVVRGRWFRPDDDAATFKPMVIDADLAKAMYGDRDPIGQKFDSDGDVVWRVVGVVPPYRKNGEISTAGVNMAFARVSFASKGRVPRNILVRMQPGTPAQIEEEMTKRLHAVEPSASFRIRRMDSMRTMMLQSRVSPIIILGIVALFLISMVALGLTGVLWQNVTRRTRELGLRRALGASGADVRHQVLAEVALLSTLAVSIGVVIVLQLPILGVFALVSPATFTFGLIASLVLIYAITLLCAAYPSWLASVVEPAEALRYE
ncbi:MAG: putative transport system permease protein [Acidobacteriota bacterium]|jgi:putative ABC transport system permease protein|nr:putative transport system permease protein [Acidobacteriota bacterium]